MEDILLKYPYDKAVIVRMGCYLTDENKYTDDIINARIFTTQEAVSFAKEYKYIGGVRILNQYEYNNIILDRIEELKGKLLILK